MKNQEIFTIKEKKELEEMRQAMKRKQQEQTQQQTKKQAKKEMKIKQAFVIGVIVGVLFTIITIRSINNYDEYLKKCDNAKGYTCNIFGK